MQRTRTTTAAREHLEVERQKAREAAAAKERRERAPENERLSRFWSQQWDDLKDYAKYPQANDKYFSTAAITASQDKQSDQMLQSAAYDAFIETMGKQGIRLSDDAQQRLVLYAIVQGWAQGIIFSQVQNWFDALNRLRELQAFPAEGDIRQDAPAVAAKPSVDALSLLSLEDASQRKEAQRVVRERWIMEDIRPLFQEWLQSLYEHWQFVPSEQQKSAACSEAEKLNLSLADRRSYDRLRIHLGRQHFFPLLLTHEEKISEDLEKFKRDNPTATAREERVWLQQRRNEGRE